MDMQELMMGLADLALLAELDRKLSAAEATVRVALGIKNGRYTADDSRMQRLAMLGNVPVETILSNAHKMEKPFTFVEGGIMLADLREETGYRFFPVGNKALLAELVQKYEEAQAKHTRVISDEDKARLTNSPHFRLACSMGLSKEEALDMLADMDDEGKRKGHPICDDCKTRHEPHDSAVAAQAQETPTSTLH